MAYERDPRRDDRHRADQNRWDRDREDRGFFDRASDEVRSWFGDDDAERRRHSDERSEGPGGQDRARYGANPDRGGASDYSRGSQSYSRSGSDYGRSSGGDYPRGASYGSSDSGRGAGNYGSSDYGRGGYGNEERGTGGYGGGSSSGGTYGQGGSGQGDYARSTTDRSGYGGAGSSYSGSRASGTDDYDRWRNQQIDSLDRDYDEYRRENQSKFDSEFSSWRTKRQGQRQHLERIQEHMEVVGSDGKTIGKVDKVRGDRVILTKNDDPDGHHHSFSCGWIETVDDKVKLNKSADEAKKAWKDEERRQPLSGEKGADDGPHNLDRSFSGTY